VTHDRYFLDNVTAWILELDRGRGIPWKGNYSSWLDQKTQRLDLEGKSQSDRQRRLQQELEWIRMSPRARQAKGKARLNAYEPELDLSNHLFDDLVDLFDLSEPVTADNLAQVIDDLAEQIGDRGTSMLRGLSRMTLVPTIVQSGIKSNNVPETATVICDARTLPHQDEAYVRAQLAKCLGDIEAEITVSRTAEANASSYDTPFAQAICQAAGQVLPEKELVWTPGLTVGFTDSRFLRPLGTTVYNFAPGNPAKGLPPSMAHGTDESVDIEGLVIGTKMMLAMAWHTLVEDGDE
jgi:acetylornithine deacetylase/succinyl-diaminopimelate desuccinylase-like protein